MLNELLNVYDRMLNSPRDMAYTEIIEKKDSIYSEKMWKFINLIC